MQSGGCGESSATRDSTWVERTERRPQTECLKQENIIRVHS